MRWAGGTGCSLKTKVNRARQKAARSPEEHQAGQAELFLKEIEELRRGPFAPLWENPLVGAFLLNSSGLVLLELVGEFLWK